MSTGTTISQPATTDTSQGPTAWAPRVTVVRSLKQRALYRFVRNPLAMTGATIIVIALLAAILAPLLAPYSPSEPDMLSVNQWPSGEHWLGTDASGVDMFSKLLFALRTTFIISTIAMGITAVLGVGIGLIAGHHGGWVDTALSRLIDVVFAFPSILVALLLQATWGQVMYDRFGSAGRLYTTMLAISLFYWVGVARVIRAEVFSLRESQFVDAAKVSGSTTSWIVRKHMLPNVLGTAAVLISLGFGDVIAIEAILSFVGLGVTPPTASLGQMIQGGQLYIDPFWYQFLVPGTALAVLVLAFAFIGDGIRDAFDPRQSDR
jgi:ABC-type dipeptide/oligopeptide/nickel transport system permease subunit